MCVAIYQTQLFYLFLSIILNILFVKNDKIIKFFLILPQ